MKLSVLSLVTAYHPTITELISSGRVWRAGLRKGYQNMGMPGSDRSRDPPSTILSVTPTTVGAQGKINKTQRKHIVVFPWHKSPCSNSWLLGNSLKQKWCLCTACKMLDPNLCWLINNMEEILL